MEGVNMFKKILQKIQKWWRARTRIIEEVEEYREEVERGTRMCGGSFLDIVKKKEEKNV